MKEFKKKSYGNLGSKTGNCKPGDRPVKYSPGNMASHPIKPGNRPCTRGPSDSPSYDRLSPQ